MVIDNFDFSLKAWFNSFVGCCGRMYIEFFGSMSVRHFLSKRIRNRRMSF